ncbi:YebC/PmpR family DNA-binding transcriptional regulator [Candidatus Riflebacteria bacterium]
MSGHSKWSTIKHKKGAADAKRGKIFSKMAKEISVAAKLGGGNPEENSRLRLGIARARAVNMPKDNIERAIKKGTGELGGQEITEVTYEGYAHGGIAVMVECLTDNKVRTVADVRYILSKHGGNLGESGSVSWNFTRKGFITVNSEEKEEDELLEIILEAGALDMQNMGEYYEIITEPDDFDTVLKAIEENGVSTGEATVTLLPNDTVKVEDEESAKKVLKAIQLLEDHDDICNVYSNFDIEESLMEAIAT